MRRMAISVVVLMVFSAVVACGGDGAGRSPFAGFTEVAGQELKSGTSSTAPGQILRLVRVIIPAGDEVAPHSHPGTQLAFISEGILTYTVIDGEVDVSRAADSGNAMVETFQTGDTLKLEVGDSIREPKGMIHMARNDGGQPVVIYLLSLFPEGEPVSNPAQ